MSFVRGQMNAVGLASATSANGTARNGAAQAMTLIEPGTLVFECTSAITTASVTATFDVQVSKDNVTWVSLYDQTQAARVATAAGTGSPVSTVRAVAVPMAASSYMYARCVATLAGAATAGADQTSVTYRFLRYGVLY